MLRVLCSLGILDNLSPIHEGMQILRFAASEERQSRNDRFAEIKADLDTEYGWYLKVVKSKRVHLPDTVAWEFMMGCACRIHLKPLQW